MFALRTTSRRIAAASISRRISPAAPAVAIRAFSTDDDTVTGTVKFYQRSKAYGFILPDDEAVGDVFVHRTSIIANDDAGDNPFFPFLRKDERVRFVVEEDPDKNQMRARNVTFEDGSIVPTVRPHYARGAAKGAVQHFGEKVYNKMSEEEMSDEDLVEFVRGMYNATANEIQDAQNRQEASDAASGAASE